MAVEVGEVGVVGDDDAVPAAPESSQCPAMVLVVGQHVDGAVERAVAPFDGLQAPEGMNAHSGGDVGLAGLPSGGGGPIDEGVHLDVGSPAQLLEQLPVPCRSGAAVGRQGGGDGQPDGPRCAMRSAGRLQVTPQDALPGFQRGGGDVAPGARRPPGVGQEPVPEGLVGEPPRDGGRHLVGIRRVEQRLGAHDLRERRRVGRQHRGAAGQRLGHRQAVALVEGREDEQVRALEQEQQHLVGEEAGDAQPVGDAELGGAVEEVVAFQGVGDGRHHERVAGPQRRIEPAPGLERSARGSFAGRSSRRRRRTEGAAPAPPPRRRSRLPPGNAAGRTAGLYRSRPPGPGRRRGRDARWRRPGWPAEFVRTASAVRSNCSRARYRRRRPGSSRYDSGISQGMRSWNVTVQADAGRQGRRRQEPVEVRAHLEQRTGVEDPGRVPVDIVGGPHLAGGDEPLGCFRQRQVGVDEVGADGVRSRLLQGQGQIEHVAGDSPVALVDGLEGLEVEEHRSGRFGQNGFGRRRRRRAVRPGRRRRHHSDHRRCDRPSAGRRSAHRGGPRAATSSDVPRNR